MGILVFRSLHEALRQGFQVYDKIPEGYSVRRKEPQGWALALVILKEENIGAHN